MAAFIIRWLVTTLAVLVAAHVVSGISYSSPGALFAASLLLGFINAFIRPVLLLLSLPMIIVTMGIFILVINALMLMLVSSIVPPFQVDGFWSAFFGAIVISLISWPFSSFFRAHDGRIRSINYHGRIKKADARVIK